MKLNVKLSKEKIKKRRNQHIKEWTRFLQDDYDWDYAYLFRMMKYKIERMRKCISNGVAVSSNIKEITQQMQEVETLLQRVCEDKYIEECFRPVDKKWGKAKMVVKNTRKGWVESDIIREKETKKNSAQVHKDVKNCWALAEKMKQNDLEKAFKIIQKNVWTWWD